MVLVINLIYFNSCHLNCCNSCHCLYALVGEINVFIYLLSKVFSDLVWIRLERCMSFQPQSFAGTKSLGTCNALCVSPVHCKVHFRKERRIELWILTSVQPLNRVNHRGIFHKICSVGIGGTVLSNTFSFSQIDHYTQWWIPLLSCQESRRAVFLAIIFVPPVQVWTFAILEN